MPSEPTWEKCSNAPRGAVHPSLQRSAASRNVLNRKVPKKDGDGCGC